MSSYRCIKLLRWRNHYDHCPVFLHRTVFYCICAYDTIFGINGSLLLVLVYINCSLKPHERIGGRKYCGNKLHYCYSEDTKTKEGSFSWCISPRLSLPHDIHFLFCSLRMCFRLYYSFYNRKRFLIKRRTLVRKYPDKGKNIDTVSKYITKKTAWLF